MQGAALYSQERAKVHYDANGIIPNVCVFVFSHKKSLTIYLQHSILFFK